MERGKGEEGRSGKDKKKEIGVFRLLQ